MSSPWLWAESIAQPTCFLHQQLKRACTRKTDKLDVNLVLNCCLPHSVVATKATGEHSVYAKPLPPPRLPLENCSFVRTNNVGISHAHSFPGLISSPCIFVPLSAAKQSGKENCDKSGAGRMRMSRRWTSKGLVWIFLQTSLITNWALYLPEACPGGRLPGGVQWLKGNTLAPVPTSSSAWQVLTYIKSRFLISESV